MANILHISRTMDIGGAERIVYQLATDLKAEFDQVHVASTGGLWESQLEGHGIKHHIIFDIEQKNIKVILDNLNKLKKIIDAHQIDIIHTHHRMAAFYVRMLQLMNGKLKHVYTAHNIFEDKRLFYKHAVAGAKLVAVSNGVQTNLEQLVKVKQKTEVIYNALKLECATSVDVDIQATEGIKIGFIGRLEKVKGLEYLLDAVNLIKNYNIKVFIAGTGSQEEELRKKVHLLELEEKIQFLGYRPDTGKIINSCDFMVMPSLQEGLPLTLIEYFFYGKPVIGTDIPGITEVLTPETGIIIPIQNSEAIVQAISTLSEDGNLRQKMGNNAKQVYKEKFDYQLFLDHYLDIYKTL